MKFITSIPDLIVENVVPTAPIKQIDEIEAIQTSVDSNIGKDVVIPKDVMDSFKLKDELNPEIWPEGKLDPQIQAKLIKIANGFLKDLNLGKGYKIKDIIFTGSLANYNWSKFSDIDLHVVLDYEQFDGDPQMIEDYFWSQKALWNNEHNIDIKGYPVEIYAQNSREKLDATAIYSVLKNKWVLKPKKENFKVDSNVIKARAQQYIDQLKAIREEYNDKHFDTVIDWTTKLGDKIRQMRKAGLERGGEFSLENLVFKVLRRTPFMDILSSYKIKAYDSKMTVSEVIDESPETESLKGGVVFILGEKTENGEQRLYATTVKSVMALDRKKVDNTEGQLAKMAVFNGNRVFRVGKDEQNNLKAFTVAWGNEGVMLKKLGLSKQSVTFNNNKTPLHWKSTKINNVAQAVKQLSPELQNLPNIKWVG